MKTLTFLLSTVIELYTMVVLLRVWMQWARCDFYNPFSQFVVKATQPVVGPLRRIIPAMGPLDSASLLVAFILCVVKAIVLFMVVTFQPIIWISALLILIKTVGSLIFWVPQRKPASRLSKTPFLTRATPRRLPAFRLSPMTQVWPSMR